MRRRVDRIPAAPSKATPIAVDGRRRVVIEAVMPEIDAGRFPAKRALGETVTVEADVFADGHDSLAAMLKYRLLPTPTGVPSAQPRGGPKAPEGPGRR